MIHEVTNTKDGDISSGTARVSVWHLPSCHNSFRANPSSGNEQSRRASVQKFIKYKSYQRVNCVERRRSAAGVPAVNETACHSVALQGRDLCQNWGPMFKAQNLQQSKTFLYRSSLLSYTDYY